MSLGRKAIRGSVWSGIDRFGHQIIQLLTTIILARVLSPDDFGLVAMISVIFAVSLILIDGGMGQALIREQKLSERDKATCFHTNLIIAIILYLVSWSIAPLVAVFFARDELVGLVRLMSLNLIFFSLSIIHRSILTHDLDFKRQSFANILAAVIAGIVSISMAYSDFGVYALATKFVLASLLSTVIFYIMKPWYPKTFIDQDSFKKLFGFGSKLMVSGIINSLFDHSYKIIIGKVYESITLGYYSQAVVLRDLASKNLVSVFERVAYPILAKKKDDPSQLSILFQDIIKSTSFLIFPAIIGLIIISEDLVLVLFGEKWQPMIPMFQIIGVTGIFYHLQSLNLTLLKVMGRSDLFLRLEIVKKVILTLAIVIGIYFGIWGLLFGQVISSVLALFINMYYTNRLTSYKIINQLKDICQLLLLSVPMIVGLLGISFLEISSLVLKLALYVAVGSSIYFSFAILMRVKTLDLLIDKLRPARSD